MVLKRLIFSTLALTTLAINSFADNKLVVTMYDSQTKEYSVSKVSEIEISEKLFTITTESDKESFPVVDVRKVTFEEDDALDNLNSQKISVYPNPVTDVMNITGIEDSSSKISIVDSEGKESKVYSAENGNQFNVSGLESGVYVVIIDGKPYFRFIKK